MGDNTHHQLQLITLHNLSPMNRIVRAPVKLSPPEDEEEVLDVMVLKRDCLIALCSIKSISLIILSDSECESSFRCHCVVCINEWIVDAPEVILVRLVDSLLTVPNVPENNDL